ncbi:hypothetical protein MW871_04780 [Flavobacterium sp. I-SCBP12n]|uniref:Methylase-associated X1 domain-containing protein n=1 Tax=Flavobacterium pygoscelis TaxID=2893176 RepID=A0A9X1XRH6_9FLAO|nr:hypothetical protein [Flavobacterium pygoscelis]MCK8141201.1 hypothetical protein [Flavobacterium pygoscelis]
MNEYKNIEKIKPETLLALMREVLDQSSKFSYINGTQPFFMSFEGQKFYVYVKNISSAYFSDRDKTTRAQLPIKKEFNLIKSSPYPFIFLGYDGINDVFVCWNFHVAKERLNLGKSVSFYSRTFFQSDVKEGELVRKKLKNGDLPILFKRSSLIEFFTNIDTFFAPGIFPKNEFINAVGKINYEEKFKVYLKENRNLSDKSIKNYSNALKSRISEGIRKYFIPTLETIYFIENLLILEELKIQIFKKEEYKALNSTGKNMYSCAFDNYINFIKNLYVYEVEENATIVNDINEEYCRIGKLLKINNSDLINEIEPYIKSNRLLSAAQIVGNYYQNQYPSMELSDWINLVREI